MIICVYVGERGEGQKNEKCFQMCVSVCKCIERACVCVCVCMYKEVRGRMQN